MNYKSLLLATILSLSTVSAFAEVVNLNKADASAFQYYLNGIGEKKASKIINYRQEHKEFKSIAEIMEVKGIAQGIFAKIKADLSLTEGKVSSPMKQVEITKEPIIKVDMKKKQEPKILEKSLEVEPKVSNTDDTSKVENKTSENKEEKLNSNKNVKSELKV